MSDDPASRVPTQAGPPGVGSAPHTLQILTTEHWSLLAARNLCYTEAMSRTSIFVAALASSVVALALVAQATNFGSGFAAFALVLLPVVYFLGLTTVIRLAQVNYEDARWTQGMNRIRNAYLQLAPELEPYFVTSQFDDERGVLQTAMAMRRLPPRAQAFISIPGAVAVIDSAVAGAAAGIAGIEFGLGTAGAIALGAGFFVLSLGGFGAFAKRRIERYAQEFEPLFPTPPTRPA